MADQFRKKGYSVRHFFTSVLTITREMPKPKGKILKRCVSYSFRKYTHNNADNDIKILYVFIENAKPYIQLNM